MRLSKEKPEGTLENVIRIDDARLRDHLNEMARRTVEEALIETYLAGVSVRRVEDITEALGNEGQHGDSIKPEQEESHADQAMAQSSH